VEAAPPLRLQMAGSRCRARRRLTAERTASAQGQSRWVVACRAPSRARRQRNFRQMELSHTPRVHGNSKVVGIRGGRLPHTPRRARHCPTRRYQTFQRRVPARQAAWRPPQRRRQQSGVQTVLHTPQPQHQTRAGACPVHRLVQHCRQLSHTLRQPVLLHTATLPCAVQAQTQQRRQRWPQRHQLLAGTPGTMRMPPTPQRRRPCPRCRCRWSCRCQSPRWPQQQPRLAPQR
jgi:hypothetical protein